MSRAFQYKPKFVDIRVRPPKEGEEQARADDVHALKPGEKPCDHPGCRVAANAKAPKSRDMPGEFYWFCQPHAAEYNKNWDFFAGMNEKEVAAAQANRAYADRPTWQFKASKFSREAASFSAKAGTGKGYGDPFGIFGAAKAREASAPARRLGKLERSAFAELVKRCHPDANGGDRSAEERLQRVIKAYKTLQKAKLA